MLDSLRSISVSVGGGQLWLENLKIRTTEIVDLEDARDEDGPISSLSVVMKQLQAPDRLAELVDEEMKNLKKKLPHEVLQGSGEMPISDPRILEQLVESACAEIRSQMKTNH